YGSPKSSTRRRACVPLPAPGGPSRTRFSSGMALLEEALVVAHHQLRLELLDRVESDADHDQDRGPAEKEVRARLVDQQGRQRRNGGEEDRARERQSRQDAIEIFGR